MSIEAMKQMVEALNDAHLDARMPRPLVNKYLAALEAGRQAIADAEKQEPKCVVIVEVFGKDWRLEYMSLPVGRHKLYTQQYLYTHPQPKREWVGLTDEKRETILKKSSTYTWKAIELVEAELKKLNT